MSQYYFDHAASAPRRDEVTEAMARWQHGVVGNPSGSHRAAREARRAVEDAREEIAGLVGAKPGGVIFTGGGTESCQLAIVGGAHRYRRSHERCEIVVSKIEHHAVLDAAEMMARDFDDVHVRYVDVDALARDVWNIIQVAFGVRIIQIDSRRQNRIIDCHDANCGFKSTSSTKQVTSH